MVIRLKSEGFWVRSVDLKRPEFDRSFADEMILGDLRDPVFVSDVCSLEKGRFDEVYQFAADMGGAGYIFTGENDADVMHNSAIINLNVAKEAVKNKVGRIFYSSSACIYPERNQLDPDNPVCTEISAYPAAPDSEYGWEKLFSERLFFSFMRNYGLEVRVARYHNVFGPLGTWKGGKEKVPAAMCRKVAEAAEGDQIEVWGSGVQTRSFLYIDECIEATIRFMRSDFYGPVNIGSEEMVSINQLAKMVIDISGKALSIQNLDGEAFIEKYGFKCPLGVMGRKSDNKLYQEKLGWTVSDPLIKGLESTYHWINDKVRRDV